MIPFDLITSNWRRSTASYIWSRLCAVHCDTKFIHPNFTVCFTHYLVVPGSSSQREMGKYDSMQRYWHATWKGPLEGRSWRQLQLWLGFHITAGCVARRPKCLRLSELIILTLIKSLLLLGSTNRSKKPAVDACPYARNYSIFYSSMAAGFVNAGVTLRLKQA